MIPPILKHALDALASAIGIACAMVSAMNVITLLTVIYWTLRIYELPTVQRWISRLHAARDGAPAGGANDAD
ncbi:hypothetical protein [Novosphingobium sp. KACC 22771]|uniref:hypothetical protein n=1 Tax=Novosphingobium sp. KACC 22771 TaxID=3025670 RepID=UPI0023659F97|nr:hypothetical protein [Novosphingobium sp. KACC 22771]WDF71480.1 hypothetical protein PQ467_11750 [Novosphingobium sp. KACC 22771]